MGATDRQLLESFLHGHEESAFAALLARHGPMVLGVCRRLLRDVHAAEDAFQATFLVLAHSAVSVRRPDALGSWLYAVAYRVAGRLRKRADRLRTGVEMPEGAAADDPVAQVVWSELRQVLDEELERLPEKYRAPLVLCHLQGQNHSEAARALGWPTSSLVSRLSRGEELLRGRLADRGLALSAGLLFPALAANAQAAVSESLVQTTAKAAALLAAGRAALGDGISTSAQALAEAVTRSMALARLKVAAAALLLLAVLAVGGGALLRPATAELTFAQPREGPAQVAPAADRKDMADLHGDPLPAGALARLGTVRLRHAGSIYYLAAGPEAGQLLTRDFAGLHTVWDVATGRELRHFDSGMRALSMHGHPLQSADGTLLAVCEGPGHVQRMWHVPSGKELWQSKPEDPLKDFIARHERFSPDGKLLVTALVKPYTARTRGGDMAIQLREAATGKELWRIASDPPMTAAPVVAFSPDSKKLAIYASDGRLRLYDAATGKLLVHLAGQLDPKQFLGVKMLAFAPDGRTAALACAEYRDGKSFGVVRIWDTQTGNDIRTVRGPADGIRDISPVFAPSFESVAWVAADGTIRLQALESGKELSRLGGGRPGQVPTGSPVFTPDGKTLACRVSPRVCLWDVVSGREIQLADLPPRVFFWNPVFSPDGKTLIAAASNESAVWLWDVGTGKQIIPAGEGHQGSILSLAGSLDGKTLTTLATDGTARRWDVVSGKELLRLRLPESALLAGAALSSDGRSLAVGVGPDRVPQSLQLWDLTADPPRPLEVARAGPCTLAYTTDGKTLAVRDGQFTVRLLDVATGKESDQIAEHVHSRDRRPSLGGCVFAPDGKTLTTLWHRDYPGKRGSEIRMWHMGTGRPIGRLQSEDAAIVQVAYAADNRSLAAIHQDYPVSTNGPKPTFTACVWELASGKERCRVKLETRPDCLTCSPDGTLLAVGFPDASICLYAVVSGREVCRLTGHRGAVLQLAFSSDGLRLISGSADTTVLLWDMGKVVLRPVATTATAEQLESLWVDLAADDATRAFTAIDRLRGAPKQVPAFLKGRLQPAMRGGAERARQLVDDLAGDDFATRQRATEELVTLGERALVVLEKTLAGKPSLDLQKRAEGVVERILALQLPAETRRALRAVEALEKIGSPEARQVLEGLTRGAEGARLTLAAQAALKRLGHTAGTSR